jgi:predicted enzyme related to lactoylglutathione lyase
VFTSPQVVLFCADVEGTAAFYGRLGFVEAFRVPADGPPKHVDVELDDWRLGLTSHEGTEEDHGFATGRDPHRAAVVLWCDDVAAAYERLLDAGATAMAGPHEFLGRLRIAWAADPEGHPIQVVQRQ